MHAPECRSILSSGQVGKVAVFHRAVGVLHIDHLGVFLRDGVEPALSGNIVYLALLHGGQLDILEAAALALGGDEDRLTSGKDELLVGGVMDLQMSNAGNVVVRLPVLDANQPFGVLINAEDAFCVVFILDQVSMKMPPVLFYSSVRPTMGVP